MSLFSGHQNKEYKFLNSFISLKTENSSYFSFQFLCCCSANPNLRECLQVKNVKLLCHNTFRNNYNSSVSPTRDKPNDGQLESIIYFNQSQKNLSWIWIISACHNCHHLHQKELINHIIYKVSHDPQENYTVQFLLSVIYHCSE